MGFDVNTVKLLLYAKKHNVDFNTTATIGRQELQLTKRDMFKALKLFSEKTELENTQEAFTDEHKYAESFLKRIGAKSGVDSYDCSSYEGATHIHDMNKPIPDTHKNKYTAVIDGGSLEHVFNYPTALKNCMEMVQQEGHFISILPANNWLGHGFYQISPELFFSVFTEKNGYKLNEIIMYEENSAHQWFRVKNPAVVKQRLTLCNNKRTYVAVIAQRVALCEIFNEAPQQSDYVMAWQDDATTNDGTNEGILERIKHLIPEKSKKKLRKLLLSPYNKKHYERMRLP